MSAQGDQSSANEILTDVVASDVLAGPRSLLQPRLKSPDGAEPDAGDPALAERWETAQRDLQVRLGTLLKTDHVSVLVAAGCSLAAGGVSLASIPVRVETALLTEGLRPGQPVAWLQIFYAAAGALGADVPGDLNARAAAAKNLVNRDADAADASPELRSQRIEFELSVNLEALLVLLHTWERAARSAALTAIGTDDSRFEISADAVVDLSVRMKSALHSVCRLPRAGRESALDVHRGLIRRVIARPAGLHRVDIFTTNYDTLLEQALDAEGVTTIDGFTGRVRPAFRPESYDHDLYFPTETTEGRVHRLDRVARLYKLHGSTTWRALQPTADNPYGIGLTVESEETPTHDLLVYPTPLKYDETLGMPYAEMFRRFASAIARPQSVLFVLGYSFGDEHINAIVRQAIAVPSFTLVIVNPTPGDAIERFAAQGDDRIWVIRGPLGRFERFVNDLLPSLREEQVEAAVARTYRDLSFSPSRAS